MEELSKALSVSVGELLTGEYRENENTSGNMKKIEFYVCPICGNIIASVGSGSFSCCGISLPKHYVSFLAYVTSDTCEIVKLYPEQEISARFRKKGHGVLITYSE